MPTAIVSTADLCTLSPTLRALLKTRLAPVRERALINAAKNRERPVKPAAGDCCGSSCKPCVMDLYREELKVWKECWLDKETGEIKPAEELGDGEGADGSGVVVGDDVGKIPGAFEW
jgi:hypothetical protein